MTFARRLYSHAGSTGGGAGSAQPAERATGKCSAEVSDRLGYEPRVAVFTDTYIPDRNGVAHSIERQAQIFDQHGIDYVVVGPNTTHVDFPVRSPTIFPTADKRYSLQIPLASPKRLASDWQANIVHIHTPFSFGLLGLRYARRLRARVVYTHHTSLDDYLHYVPLANNALGRRFLRGYMRWFARKVDSLIVPSAAARDLLIAIGLPDHKHTLLPTPLDRIHTAEPEQWPEKEYDLLFVGRLAAEKNPDLLIATINALLAIRPDAEIAIVGDGLDRPRVLREIQAESRPNIHYLGEMDKHQLLEVFRAARLVYSPSLTETQGLVLQEALSQGVPVIALRSGQVAEFLRDGHNGLLLPPDAQTIAAAMRDLLDSPDRSAELRANAFEVRERFGPDRWLDGFLSAVSG